MSFVGRPIRSDTAKARLLQGADHMREVAVKTGRKAVRLRKQTARSTNPLLITGNEIVTSSFVRSFVRSSA